MGTLAEAVETVCALYKAGASQTEDLITVEEIVSQLKNAGLIAEAVGQTKYEIFGGTATADEGQYFRRPYENMFGIYSLRNVG